MNHTFYHTAEYRSKLSELSKKAWARGVFDHLLAKIEERRCERTECTNFFSVKRYSANRFCSQRCAAICHNIIRGPRSLLTRQKIAHTLRTRAQIVPSAQKGKIIVPRLVRNCLTCNKQFETLKSQNHKYCSVFCSIRDIGSRITSPKAAKGKSGIRKDISPTICFYSRWEANFARILNMMDIQWEFQPRRFDLLTQKYTPDFYLPEYDLFIEIKNFLSEFSRNRDERFRKLYPDIKLHLLLKDEYLELQKEFAPMIDEWEYS